MNGKFIVLEGIDGSGKTSLAHRLAEGKNAWLTAEPTDGVIGKILRSDSFEEKSPACDALLFAADRQAHTKKISQELEKGKWVICDRYQGSTIAYQSAANENQLDFNWLIDIQKYSIIEPDATILLDINPEISMKRVSSRGENLSRFEEIDYQRRVRDAYLKLAKMFDYIVIDASAEPEEVFAKVVDALKKRGINASE